MSKFLLVVFSIISSSIASSQVLSYYLPTGVNYNPVIPKPKDIINHEVGEWHISHDKLVSYMQAIATAAPERAKLVTIGHTYENRPQVVLIFTSKKNHDNLEQIRQQHILLSDPSRSSALNIKEMPIIVHIGHSIHGNEPSGSNAALLTTYYLAAAEGRQIENMLEKTVILLDPSFNPDGLQRFASWVNQHKGKTMVSDAESREFNEVWPGGRFNHYWFDLNRDWLPAVHPESINRLKFFHEWKPNILTDHHEQGSNATFFFQPGVPSRVNNLTPPAANLLTEKLGKYHARYLDSIGSMYFTKENYDDFYYGKGSTYPDINGGIGILFEQGSSRGHARQTTNGLLRFPFTIKNQFVTTLSTLEGAQDMRLEFLEFQREFYKQSLKPALVKGYVFGDRYDKSKTAHFLELLRRHQVIVHELKEDWKDNEFQKGSAFVVSMNQPQQVLIRALFEKQHQYKDSLFYDITSWTMPLAFSIPHRAIDPSIVSGKELGPIPFPKGFLNGNQADYAYIIEWEDLYAPRALYELLDAGILAKVATNAFELNMNGTPRKFNYGTIIIPVQIQPVKGAPLYELLKVIAEKSGIAIYPVLSGMVNNGSDLGSNKHVALTKPVPALIVGTGVNATDAGEVWHLLDQRMNMPLSLLEIPVFNRADLSKYNTIIMSGGSYSGLNRDKLKTWIQAGGTLLLNGEAVQWASQNGLNNVTFKKLQPPVDSSQVLPYIKKEQIDGAQQMRGAIFEAITDLTHPLFYGYHTATINMFKSNKVFMEKSKNPYATPLYFGEKPLISGWASKENTAGVKNAASIIVNTTGNGRVINFSESPVFRGMWFGGFKLFMNAIFFGRIIDAGSGSAISE